MGLSACPGCGETNLVTQFSYTAGCSSASLARGVIVCCVSHYTRSPVTRPTLVWNGILVGLFLLCPVTDISATVAPIGVKFCIMVYISVPDRYFPFWGRYPRPRDPKSEIFGLNFGHLTANISETVSRSVTCQHQLDDCFLGMLSQRAVPAPPPGGECTPVCRVCVLLTHLLSIIVSPRLLSMSVRPSVVRPVVMSRQFSKITISN